MLMLPLILAVSVLSLSIAAGIVLILLRFRRLERQLVAMDRELRQFYCDLGRPKAEIISINGRKWPS